MMLLCDPTLSRPLSIVQMEVNVVLQLAQLLYAVVAYPLGFLGQSSSICGKYLLLLIIINPRTSAGGVSDWMLLER